MSRTGTSHTCRISDRGAGRAARARPKSTPGAADPAYPAAGCPPHAGASGAGSRPASPGAYSWRGPSRGMASSHRGATSSVTMLAQGAAPHPFTFMCMRGTAAPQQRLRAIDTRHRRPAQETCAASRPLHRAGRSLRCRSTWRAPGGLPQTGHLSADRGGVFDQGSGLGAVQAAAREAPGAGRAARRGMMPDLHRRQP